MVGRAYAIGFLVAVLVGTGCAARVPKESGLSWEALWCAWCMFAPGWGILLGVAIVCRLLFGKEKDVQSPFKKGRK